MIGVLVREFSTVFWALFLSLLTVSKALLNALFRQHTKRYHILPLFLFYLKKQYSGHFQWIYPLFAKFALVKDKFFVMLKKFQPPICFSPHVILSKLHHGGIMHFGMIEASEIDPSSLRHVAKRGDFGRG